MSELNEDPVKVANGLGLSVVLPEDDELFIDLDNEADRAVMNEGITILDKLGIHLKITKETVSPGGNRHVYIKASAWPKSFGVNSEKVFLTPTDRVLLQACLGSDRKRELLSWLRIVLPDINRPPSLFFEKGSTALEEILK